VTEPVGAQELRVLLVGPHLEIRGGMSTVQRELLQLADDHLRVRHLPAYTDRSRPAMVGMFAAAVRALRAETATPGGADVVHLHLSQRGSFVRGLVLTRSLPARLPVVVTVHGSGFRPFARRFPRLVRSVLQRADVVTTLSEGSAEVVADLGIADVRVVPNFVSVPDTTGSVRETGPVALTAGLVSRRKGHDVLFAAWEQVVERLPEARLLVAGPPGDVVVPALPGVEPLGAVPRDQVLRHLEDARVGVLASRQEGLPMFVLEAMAAGRPVVTTDIEVLAGVVADGGWVVPPGDATALAAALLAPLGDPAEAGAVGDRARHVVTSRYSREVVGRTWRELYAEVCRP
jgi:glycosyltransferase involved in cell wall biosynthesis